MIELFMGIKARRESPMNPDLLKLGLALAFSVGGIVFTFLKSRRIKPSDSDPSQPCPEDFVAQSDDLNLMENHNHQFTESSPKALYKDEFLLPEFDLLVKEYSVLGDDISLPCFVPDSESLASNESDEVEDDEKLIKSLQNNVKFLEYREKFLETELIKFYCLKEEEAEVYGFKMDSLLKDNLKLKAKVTDYRKIAMELEEANAMVMVLRKKLKSEAEQNKENVLKLREQVMKLHEEKTRNDANFDIRSEGARGIKELEEMRMANENLKIENSELALKLEKLQLLVTSGLDNSQIEELERENKCLVQKNEALSKEIEQLKTDRYADVEELVYLRWVNACLRYELRHYQPGPGKLTARNLSRTLSPNSEEKAKNLILEYAKIEDSADKITIFDDEFDFGQWHSDGILTGKRNSSSKSKVFAKLLSIWRGKDDQKALTLIPSPRSSFEMNGSDSGNRMSNTSIETSSCSRTISEDCGLINTKSLLTVTEGHDPVKAEVVKYAEALEIPHRRSCSGTVNENGSLRIFGKMNAIRGKNESLSTGIDDHDHDPVKDELVKYTEVLEIAHRKPALHRKTVGAQ